MPARIDSTGQQFGSWLVEHTVRRPYEKALVQVRCVSCGRRASFRASRLRAGRVRQCCALRGQVFGDLEVLASAPNVPSRARHLPKGYTAVRCRCRGCGREVIVATARLTAPHDPKRNCGCLSRFLLPSAPLDSTPPAVDAAAVSAAPDVPLRTTTAQQALDAEFLTARPFGAATAASRRHDADDDTFGRAITCDDVPDFQEDR